MKKLFLLLQNIFHLKKWDNYGDFEWSGRSKLKKDYYPLFQLLEYENLLDNYFVHASKKLESIPRSRYTNN